LDGAVIYVYRQKKNGDIGMARPCSYCLEILREKGYETIYASITDIPIKNEKFVLYNIIYIFYIYSIYLILAKFIDRIS
jgi:hypothetical protein